MKANWPLCVALAMENIAVGVALSGFIWISQLPYRLTPAQAQNQKAAYAVVGLSLIVAWGAIGLTIAGRVLHRRKLVGGTGFDMWVVVSFLMTLVLSLAHLTGVHLGSVGR